MPEGSGATELAITIAAQLPVVVLFIFVIFKLLDRFDKVQEKRDTQFLTALSIITCRMDDLKVALKDHDTHVNDRIAQVRKRSG